MLRLKNDQMDLWESIFPKESFPVNEELEAVDHILSDEQFFEPYIKKYNEVMGRPTVPVDTYHRMMYINYRYQLSYEQLEHEINDSIAWRRFCRVQFHELAPDGTTLCKLTKKYGEDTIQRINEMILEKYKEKKVIRGKKLRTDTTVVHANIHYPTDAGLLTDCIRTITRTVTKLKERGVKIKERFNSHLRNAKRTLLGMSKSSRARTGESKKSVSKGNGKLVELTKKTVSKAQRIFRRIRKSKNPGIRKLREEFKKARAITEEIISQTEEVLKGNTHIPDRKVSIFDTGAIPIKRGKSHTPTEFGRKVVLQEAERGVITGYDVPEGNPRDVGLVDQVLNTHKRVFGRLPEEFAADRGYYSQEKEEELKSLGVDKVCIPALGKTSKQRKRYQRQFWFKRLLRFRAGSESTISNLCRMFSFRRSLSQSNEGAKSWIGWSIFSYNLWRYAVWVT